MRKLLKDRANPVAIRVAMMTAVEMAPSLSLLVEVATVLMHDGVVGGGGNVNADGIDDQPDALNAS